MRFLRELRAKYGADQLWTWFPLRRTLLVLAPDTIEAVLKSDANAADAPLKKRALSRFVPEALLISSGDKWRIRRTFNEALLDSGRPHRHQSAFRDIVFEETERLPDELIWPDFQALGARVSQQIVLGADQWTPAMTAHLAHLVRCGNLLVRGWASFAAFYHPIVERLGASNPPARGHCLLADSRESLVTGRATETARVPTQIGFWLYVLKDAVELHVARTLALIAAHPEAQERARREIRDAGRLTADAIDRLAFLEACLLEQLRLWTPVPLLLRRAVRPFFLRDEIPVEAEQQIVIHAGFYHRDERIFGERADRFSPEAVAGGRSAGDAPDTYFFSAHRQACAGRSLVTFVLKATLASLLSRARFELIGPTIDPDAIPYLYDHFGMRLRTRADG